MVDLQGHETTVGSKCEEGEMMEPIIQTIVTQMNAQFEEDCLKVVNSYGFHVNKERLLQALTDARKFYDEGYADGKRDSMRHGRWYWKPIDERTSECTCSVCERGGIEEFNYCPNCGADMRGDNHEP